MARTAGGRELLAQAKASVAKAKTVVELRQAQAVLLSLEFGLALEQTAEAVGVSRGWVCRSRTQFHRAGGQRRENKPIHGGVPLGLTRAGRKSSPPGWLMLRP